ncbi:MAG: hypothetical protein HND48_01310 [Chloroflexi bacterium]|jgi:hypothetical protein|nr:hypothetical protein [Chloroflexota bacterium]
MTDTSGLSNMTHHRLEFVASLTVCPSDIRKIQKHLSMAEHPLNPLRHVLITPLFANRGSLDLVNEMSQRGTRVMFDSGGYYVQTGRVTYEELFYPLLEVFLANPWAQTFVLPDNVPTGRDSDKEVAYKVSETVRTSKLFFEYLPDDLKARAMPVVHGRNQRQIDECLSTYLTMGVSQIGFGSFGTMGTKNEVNVATQSAIELATYVIKVAHQHNTRVHLFGLGVPAIAAMLKGIGADSFDSSSWLKAAGFGQVFLPFMRAHNITYKSSISELQKGITEDDFEELKHITGHTCNLCSNSDALRSSKMYRAVHNLVVLAETVEMINGDELSKVRAIYKQGSPKYRNEVEKWLAN